MADISVVSEVVSLFGTPTNFAGWVLLYCICAFLFVVMVTIIFILPFTLFSRR